MFRSVECVLKQTSIYDTLGRMTAKTADGQPVFSNAVFNTTAKPHDMDAATTAAGVFPATPQTVTYTGFDKVSKVKQGADSVCYTYGYDRQRILMEEHVGNTTRTKRYVGNCELVTESDGNSTNTYCMNNPLRYVDPSGWLAGGGNTGYFPNSTANAFDPYMFYGGRIPLEPRDLGIRELSTADPIITWMEENSLHGGGNGVKGGWYKDVDGTIKYGNDVTSSSITNGQVFLGTTYTSKDGATYYGLFGETYDLRTEQGRLGKDIDEAFINYVQYSNEMSNGLFGYSYDGSSEPIQKATNFGNIVQYNNNDNIKTYRYNDILVILIVCETKPPYPEDNMNAVFCGWSSAYPTRFVNGERIETGPISISYSMSESTTFGKGYPLYFCPKGNDNPRVIMFFIDAQTRNVFNQQWNHTFGY